MMKFLVPFLSLLLGGQALAEENLSKKILFIGNSYTGGIRKAVSELIKSSPHADTQLTFITPGGKTLDFHSKQKGTIEKIKSGKFDFVVLQDQSQTPAVFPNKFQKAAVALDKIIDKSGAQTVYYQTWGRRDGDKQNKKLFPTYEAMQKALTKSYTSDAKKCDATLAPVGETWSVVRKLNPELGKALYAKDGSHPSNKGAYLAACVFYATLFDEDPRTLTFTGKLPEKESKLIQKVAFEKTKR